jgi:hypothetical protein
MTLLTVLLAIGGFTGGGVAAAPPPPSIHVDSALPTMREPSVPSARGAQPRPGAMAPNQMPAAGKPLPAQGVAPSLAMSQRWMALQQYQLLTNHCPSYVDQAAPVPETDARDQLPVWYRTCTTDLGRSLRPWESYVDNSGKYIRPFASSPDDYSRLTP